MFENLEPRVLLTVSLVNGTLTVTGTGQDDLITLVKSGSNIHITSDPEGLSLDEPLAQVTRIAVIGNGSNFIGDDISIDTVLTQPATITTGGGADAIVSGSGPTSITGGAGADDITAGNGGNT